MTDILLEEDCLYVITQDPRDDSHWQYDYSNESFRPTPVTPIALHSHFGAGKAVGQMVRFTGETDESGYYPAGFGRLYRVEFVDRKGADYDPFCCQRWASLGNLAQVYFPAGTSPKILSE